MVSGYRTNQEQLNSTSIHMNLFHFLRGICFYPYKMWITKYYNKPYIWLFEYFPSKLKKLHIIHWQTQTAGRVENPSWRHVWNAINRIPHNDKQPTTLKIISEDSNSTLHTLSFFMEIHELSCREIILLFWVYDSKKIQQSSDLLCERKSWAEIIEDLV